MVMRAPDDQQVGLAPMTGARFEAPGDQEAFGGGQSLARAAGAAEGANEETFKIAHAAWEQANQVKVLAADNSMNEFEAKTVYDPKNGALTKRGMDAFPLPEQVLEAYDKHAKDVASKLTNEEQRISFTHLANSRRFMLERVVGRHVDNELKAYNQQVTNDSVKNAADMAVANYSDPEIVAAQIDKQKAVLTDFAVRNGIPPKIASADKDGSQIDNPILTNMIETAVSGTHSGVIKQFAENGLSEVGNAYLQKHKAELLPRDAQAAEDIIRHRLPQDIASRIYKSVPALPDGSPDRLAAQKKIDGITGLDPEQKLAAFNAFEAFANHDATAVKRNNEANDTAFYSKVMDMANHGSPVDAQKKVADQLVAKLANGNPDKYDLQKKYDWIEQVEKGVAGKNDPETLIRLHQGMLDGTITDSGPILAEMKNGNISNATAASLAVTVNSGRSPAMLQKWKEIDASAESPFPQPEDRKNFMAILHEQAIEQKITDPVKLKELYDANISTVKTGAPGFWKSISRGYFDTEKESQYAVTQSLIHQNAPLVKAMGSGKAVFTLAQKMGGPENFAPGTPYSKAVLALVQRGARPDQILPASVEAVLQKHPEWIK